MNLDTAPIHALQGDEANTNRHTERGRQMTRRSVDKFGPRKPLELDAAGRVIDGNDRLDIYTGEGVENVVIVDHQPGRVIAIRYQDFDLSDKDNPAREYQIAQARSGQVSLDFDPAAIELNLEAGMDLGDWFTDFELSDMGIGDGMGGDGETADAEPQTSRSEELREEWGTELGQLWRLESRTAGQSHYLICGDCTDKATVERVMMGEKARAIISDPPYGLAAGMGDIYDRSTLKAHAALRASEWDKDVDILNLLQHIPSTLAADGSVYVFTSHLLFGKIRDWLGEWTDYDGFCVWKKTNPTPSLHKRHWTWAAELVNFGVRGKHVFNFNEGHHTPNVWDFPKGDEATGHPTQKPVAVIEHIVATVTHRGDLVADFFLGSGTALIAAENLSRQCRAIEISPAYVAVALQRYADAFGIRPELAE